MPILARTVRESLWNDSREMLPAARDRLSEYIDTQERLTEDRNKNEKDCTNAALYEASFFHEAGQTEDNGLP